MEQQVVQAIQQKYNLSGEEAQKVVQTLVQVEHKRQAETDAGSAPAGMRGTSRGMGSDIMGLLGGVLSSGGQQQTNQPGITDDIMGMVGGMLGGGGNQHQGGQGGLGGLLGGLLGGSGSGQQQGNQPGITDDIMGMIGGMLGGGGNQQQGGQGGMNMGSLVGTLLGGNHNMGSTGNMLGAVLDLLSDGGQQNHANSLESIVGGLLGGDAGQGNMNVGSLVGSLLGGSQPPQQNYQQPAPPAQHQQPSQPTKPDMGSMQNQFGNLVAGNKKKKE
jgi:hypothetical protein